MKEMLGIITIAIVLFILFLTTSGFELSTNPFVFKIKNPLIGLGVVCMIVGCSLLMISSYKEGQKNSAQDKDKQYITQE